jgi:electron-transferring-flavoprotein dehydrogenase
MTVVPAQYPPPFRASDYVVKPKAGEDERIEVGVLFVGGGPAGLAGAVRLGQLLAEAPDVAEQLGEVPIAVVEKGKGPGSHLLSGAVVRPAPLKALFPDGAADAIPTFGTVTGEAVYALTKSQALRLPTPPDMKNHGNWILSISQLARFLAAQAEELGAYLLPETDAQKLLVNDAKVLGVLTGDKGRGREGEELGNFEPGVELHAQVTVLSEGTQGHLTGVATKHFNLEGPSPQIYALGVKEIWEVPKPLGKIVHTLGWPLRRAAKYREFGGSFIYPMGENMVAVGFVVGLDSADATLSCHDLLQELKSHKLVRGILEGGKRVAWGAKTIPEGGYYAMPRRLHVPGAIITGDSAGMVNVPALKGVNYAIQSGILAAEAIFESLQQGRLHSPAGLWGYDTRIRESFIWKDMFRTRNMRPAFQKGFYFGLAVGGMATASMGKMPKRVPFKADAQEPVFLGDRAASYPKPDGQYYFDKLSSVFLSGNKTRDDQPNHIRIQRKVPKELATSWDWMCPAKVYELEDDGSADTVTVRINASNCVQCGAITAKGGRLTPPEGGSGPEYTLT